MQLARRLGRNSGFLIALAIAAWLGVEVGGKGTGVVKWLFSPGLTRDQGFHPMDIIGARPKGPVRLTRQQADTVDARLKKAFGGNVPRHERTSGMHFLYELKPDARCPQDRSDLIECNKVQRMEAFFAEVLRVMHPATEHLLWLERKSYQRGPGRDQPFRVAVFLGADEKVKIAFDLRRVKRAADFRSVTVRSSDTSGLKDLAAREVSDGLLVVDDPGPLQQPKHRPAAIDLYGGTNPPENGVLSLMIEGDLLVRHRFFSAVLGKPVGGVDATQAAPASMAAFEPRGEPVHAVSIVSLRAALIDSVGPERAAKVRFSKMRVRGGRGSFYGLVLDGARQFAIDVTDPDDRKHYEFFWDGPEGLQAVANMTPIAEREGRDREGISGPYYLISIAEAGSAERLLVFRRGERGAPIAGLWPLRQWLETMAPLIEADPKALADAGVDMSLVGREARSDAWMARCERFLSAYPSFEVKTSGDEWRRGACEREAAKATR